MPTYLEQLTRRPLAKPCTASWDAMAGDHKTRQCAQCDQRVYHLSAMTRMEAEIRLLNAEGLPCIRYALDPLGNVAMQSGVTPARAQRPSSALLTAGALAVAAIGPQAMAADPVAPPAASPSGQQCARPASAPAAAAPVPAPGPPSPPPVAPLGGAPMPPQEAVPQGVLEVRSATKRPFTIAGVEFEAPATAIKLPPGKHELLISEAGKPVRKVTVMIKKDIHTVVSLDPQGK